MAKMTSFDCQNDHFYLNFDKFIDRESFFVSHFVFHVFRVFGVFGVFHVFLVFHVFGVLLTVFRACLGHVLTRVFLKTVKMAKRRFYAD